MLNFIRTVPMLSIDTLPKIVHSKKVSKLIIPVLYSIGIIILISFQWAQTSSIRQGSGGPIYRNLMDGPAFIKRGFDIADIKTPQGEEWVKFSSPPFTVTNSLLPELPRRRYFSPFGKPEEEFTIVIQIEMDNDAIIYMDNNPSIMPGIFFAFLGENWEVYLNGSLVRSELHLDKAGLITQGRSWRDVHFPVNKNLFVLGTNILTLRIVGDPAYGCTGLYYTMPYYIDGYQVILQNHQSYFRYLFSGIFAFTGIYYLLIFLAIRKKEELYNLYYSLFSLGLSIHYLMQDGSVRYIFPNSDIGIAVEYCALLITTSVLTVFIEKMGRQRVTKATWCFLGIALYFAFTQIFFCKQYGDEALQIFLMLWLVYFPVVIIGNLRHHIRQRRETGETSDTFFALFTGSLIIYICGIHDALDIVFFRNYFRIVHYSTLVFHIGMAFALSNRYSAMIKYLERSNIILENTVKERTLKLEERTLELEKQTDIAVQASLAKSKFLATMSHEIRTPLTVISGHVQQVKRMFETSTAGDTSAAGDAAQAISHSLARAQEEIMRAARITRNTIRFSSMQESKHTFKLLDMADLLTTCTEAYRVLLEKHGNHLVVNIEDDLPPVYGNGDLLMQVIVNLLANSNHYTKDGEITVSCNLQIDNGLAPSPRFITVTVTDTGSGVPPDLLPLVFERGISSETDNAGIGLAICREIIESHNGTIEMESSPGRGTTLLFRVPVQVLETKVGENA